MDLPIRGRGTAQNPTSRFEKLLRETDEEAWRDTEEPAPATRFFKSCPKTILTKNDSPDVGPEVSLNPYRGCEHGCVYCYARPTHETFGMSAGLDFETKILVKENASALLRKELSSLKWTPKVVGMGTVTDVYQPVEKRYGITRELLKVFLEFRNPVFIITKNFLVTRDIDLLSELARHRAAAVYVSVTTLDNDVARVMEPRTSLPAMRLKAIETLSRAGVPVGVSLAPVIPGLTDHEMPAILEQTSKAGARHAWYAPVRLPHGVADLFQDWLSKHYADRKEKILNRIRQMREGRLNDSRFHTRMEGKGTFADQWASLFHVYCQKYSLNKESWDLSTASFRRSGAADLFP